MSLKKYLTNLHVKAFTSIPKENKNPCLIVGNLLSKKGQTKEDFYHLSPIAPLDEGFKKLRYFSKYEVGSEEGVLALLLNFCHVKSDERLVRFLDELDVGYISAECSIGEEEFEDLNLHVNKQKTVLCICEDLEFHKRAENIAKLLSMIGFYCDFDIVYESLDADIDLDEILIADEIDEIESYDGAVVYFVDGNEKIFGSHQFALANKLKDNDRVLVKTKAKEFERVFVLNDKLKGTTSFLEYEDHKGTYAYEVSKISRIGYE